MNTDYLRLRLLAKINIIILQPAKNLMFFFSSQKIKKEILRTKVLRMTRKGKLTKILEHFQLLLGIYKFHLLP
jgi:hypothetical protein